MNIELRVFNETVQTAQTVIFLDTIKLIQFPCSNELEVLIHFLTQHC